MTTLLAPLTVDDIMELLPGLTERAVKEILREHKCASQIRGKLYVSLDQFNRLLKETDLCRSKSNGAAESLNSTELSTESAIAKALELATRRSRPTRQRRSRCVSDELRSTEPTANTPLPTRP